MKIAVKTIIRVFVRKVLFDHAGRHVRHVARDCGGRWREREWRFLELAKLALLTESFYRG